jgi:glycosyltransferase involved in cell wall biosynthesis
MAGNAPMNAQTTASPLPLSVAIITRNEEADLPRCLESVAGLAAEIVVLDSGSTDATVAIAQRFGARVEITDWPGFTIQKNRALAACREPWVLSLDADEALSPELATAIRALFAAEMIPARGYWINRRNRYLGAWLRHAWTPEWRLRLVAREEARWVGGQVHEHIEVAGSTARLAGDLLHESYQTLDEHLRRTLTYARLGAEDLIACGEGFRPHKLLLSPWGRFLRTLIVQQAWRDGWRGLLIAASSMLAAFAKYAFVLEHALRRQEPPPP